MAAKAFAEGTGLFQRALVQRLPAGAGHLLQDRLGGVIESHTHLHK